MIVLLIESLYFFLPAYVANMSASLSKNINFLKPLRVPVDFGKKINGYRIFGDHKTWRGLISGTLTGTAIAILQLYLYNVPYFEKISLIDYKEVNILLFGFLISFGAIFGDILFAFFKRRKNIKPGSPWIPFDQINFVIGSFLLLSPFIKIEIGMWLIIFILTFFLHIIVNHIGYFLGLQKNKC